MCRFAAYLGPAVPLAALLYDPPHGLDRQAFMPRQMVSGHVNVDGTGVAWWERKEPGPLRYVSERPPWSDANLPLLATRLQGSPILAAVRSQTAGMPAGVEAAHPFVAGRWAGAHNGYLERFAELRSALLDRIDEEAGAALTVHTDSALLFAMVVSALRDGAEMAAAVVGTAAFAARSCVDIGAAASLNLVVMTAGEIVALRAARGVEANSLYALEGGAAWPEARLIASEPLDDDPGWRQVPEGHLVRLTGARLETTAAGI